MECSICKNEIGNPKCLSQHQQAFQVRVGSIEEDDGVTFLPDEDIGYYCSECLKEGV